MRYIIKLSEMWGDRLRLSVACQLMGGCEIRISELSESTPPLCEFLTQLRKQGRAWNHEGYHIVRHNQL